MKFARLLHNPTAGDEEHSKNELLALLEKHGIECSYFSTKKNGWEEIESGTDMLIIGGGDGTVRKVAEEILERKLIDKVIPIGILPLGTANNIAKTLGIEGDSNQIIETWDKGYIKKFDVGRVEGLPEIKFMLEGLGYGVFPRMVKEMKKVDKILSDDPVARMKTALEKLHDIILTTDPFYCQVTVDGINYYGKYLLVQVMNICSVGPNLQLAATADPGDGKLDVVLVPDTQREALAVYIQNKLQGIEEPSMFNPIRANSISLETEEPLLHIDDELIKVESPAKLKIELQEGRLEFFVPRQQ